MIEKNYIEKVHEVTRRIPVGRVSTYGDIADYLCLGSARMVEWALNKVSLWDDSVPAHRVVNRKGELSGRNNFATPDIMKDRLRSEGVAVDDWKVSNFSALRWHPEEGN